MKMSKGFYNVMMGIGVVSKIALILILFQNLDIAHAVMVVIFTTMAEMGASALTEKKIFYPKADK